ncbi:hypothetical protein EJB05_00221, partial [Eragrostis curvula]
MPPPSKRARVDSVAAEATPGRCPLPADLLLEIVARSDAATLIRCAATCKPLRREIRRPAFIRRVCHDGPDAMVPRRLVGFLCLGHESIIGVPSLPASFSSLAHPAASLSETRLLCRRASADAGRLAGYEPLASRDGLVLLLRASMNGKRRAPRLDMCVYDPMAGNGGRCTFVPWVDDLSQNHNHQRHCKHALLTPADGIGGSSSFLLVAADFLNFSNGALRTVKIRTWSSSSSDTGGGAWSAVTFAINARPSRYGVRVPRGSAVVGGGGFVHWLMHEVYDRDCHIFTYNVLTAAAGWVELPAEFEPDRHSVGRFHLASSPPGVVDGRLSLLVEDDLNITVWLLSGRDRGGACWTRHFSVAHQLPIYGYHPHRIATVSSGARSGTVVLLPYAYLSTLPHVAPQAAIVLDLATKEMYTVHKEKPAFLYEVDMLSRLSAIKNL